MASFAAAAPRTSYTLLAKLFHWSIALLMASMFVTIWIRGITERESAARAFWTDVHTSLGLLVFGLAVLRLVIRPRPPEIGASGVAALLRHAMHGTLLALTLLVPIAGFVRMAARNRVTDFFGYVIPTPFGDAPAIYGVARALHGDTMQYVVLALVGLHVAAALGHHYVLRDDTLRRMT